MKYRFKNKTDCIQQLSLISGGSVVVLPRSRTGGFVDLDISTMYKDEFERARNFFEVTLI
ncbi:MAG: hypothetical protein GY853_01855 [PVC group bacterium]|nr:hypothetical protein [PVC group bacterium]